VATQAIDFRMAESDPERVSWLEALLRNVQIEPLTDNKTVRLPGAAPGWTSPLQRRRSGAKRRTSGREHSAAAALNAQRAAPKG